MTIDDFLAVMAANADQFPNYMALADADKRYIANVNSITGSAEAYIEDGKLLAVGGIRYCGIGEAWLMSNPEIRKDRKFTLFREAKEALETQRQSLNLWRIFADARLTANFLEHLGFEKSNTHIWTNTR